MQFRLRIKEKNERGKGKTTDFFLLCFQQIRNGVKGTAGYLIPYEFFDNVNEYTLSRRKVKEEIKQYCLMLNSYYLIEKKLDVTVLARIVGHTDIALTLNVYANATDNNIKQLAKGID